MTRYSKTILTGSVFAELFDNSEVVVSRGVMQWCHLVVVPFVYHPPRSVAEETDQVEQTLQVAISRTLKR